MAMESRAIAGGSPVAWRPKHAHVSRTLEAATNPWPFAQHHIMTSTHSCPAGRAQLSDHTRWSRCVHVTGGNSFLSLVCEQLLGKLVKRDWSRLLLRLFEQRPPVFVVHVGASEEDEHSQRHQQHGPQKAQEVDVTAAWRIHCFNRSCSIVQGCAGWMAVRHARRHNQMLCLALVGSMCSTQPESAGTRVRHHAVQRHLPAEGCIHQQL